MVWNPAFGVNVTGSRIFYLEYGMSKEEYPVTTGVRFLREHGIAFTPHLYTYEEHGGTKLSAVALGVPEHEVVKTLVFETDLRKPLIVLMHGDCEVSTKELARTTGVKRIEPCDAASAQRATGYVFGGTSPFGTRTSLPVYVEKTILALSKIYINGGKRGFLVELDPAIVKSVLHAIDVEVAIPQS
jgi:Cys-tRNA(Pro) deacylase